MICPTLKECIEGTRHVVPKEKKTRKRGKGAVDRKKDEKADIYQLPLCPSPCCSKEQQDRCIEFIDCRPRIACSERGKSYTLDQSQEYPRHEIIQLHMDGGVISNPEASTVSKCDYVVLIKEGAASTGGKRTAILIELKGKEIHHALEQIMATLHRPEFDSVWRDCSRVFGRIVCKSASVPRIWSTDKFMAAKEEFLTRGGNLKLGEATYLEEYRNL